MNGTQPTCLGTGGMLLLSSGRPAEPGLLLPPSVVGLLLSWLQGELGAAAAAASSSSSSGCTPGSGPASRCRCCCLRSFLQLGLWPSTQCCFWHLGLQYATIRQPVHRSEPVPPQLWQASKVAGGGATRRRDPPTSSRALPAPGWAAVGKLAACHQAESLLSSSPCLQA